MGVDIAQEEDLRKEDMERQRNLRTLINKVNKECKANVLAISSEVPNVYHYRCPTGVMDLDIDLGGGFPCGGMSVLAGPESSGKTTLMYESMAMNQRIFGEASICGLACVEGLPDYWHMRDRGMMVEIPDEIIEQKAEERKFRGIKPFSKEEIKSFKTKVGELILIRGETTEEILNRTIDAYESKAFNIIGVDSINASVSEAENKLKDGLEDRPQQSADALILTRFCNRMHQASRGITKNVNKSTLLMVAQVRANRDRANAPGPMQKYIRQFSITLPWSVRHAMLVCLLVTTGEKLREKGKKTDDGDNERGKQVGKVIHWETIKGKAGTHDGLKGEVDFRYVDGIDLHRSVIRGAYRFGVLKDTPDNKLQILRAGTGEPLFDPIEDGDVLVEMMRQDMDFELKLRHEVFAALH